MSTSEQRTEQRAVIKFCAMSGMTPTDTWKFMNQKEGVRNCSRTIVFDWHKRFRDGQTEITDSARSGRPGNDQRSIQDVKDVIAKYRRKLTDDIADTVGLCHGTVHKIVTHDLNMNKYAPAWYKDYLQMKTNSCRHETSLAWLTSSKCSVHGIVYNFNVVLKRVTFMKFIVSYTFLQRFL